MTLEATAINLTLGGRTILTDASIRVDSGRVMGLLGPNGAGKSTLLRSLAGLEPSAKSTRTLNGVAAPTRADSQWARKVAYLPQTGDLNWPVTVREVVALGRLPHHTGPWGSQSAQDRTIVDRAMQQADVNSLANRAADALSGGERTRMMLARALATEPDYLLADEPVAGLDPGHQLQVMELLRARAGAGMGLLVVLHDLTLACRYCDTVVLLNAGRVVAQGNPLEVLNPTNLANVFGVRVLAANTPDGPVRVPIARLPKSVS